MAKLKKKPLSAGIKGSRTSRTKKSETPVTTSFDSGEYVDGGEKGSGTVAVVDDNPEVLGALGVLVEEIKEAHQEALHCATSVVLAAASAGEKLLEAKVLVEKEGSVPFTKWVEQNTDMSWRTGYSYIQVHEAQRRHAINLADCKSIREVLALCAAAKGSSKPDRDPKVDSWVNSLRKVEEWFNETAKEDPIENWDDDRKKTVRDLLSPIVSFHRKLKPSA